MGDKLADYPKLDAPSVKAILDRFQFDQSSDRVYKRDWEGFVYTLYISSNLISISEEHRGSRRWRINKLYILSSGELDYILNRLFARQMHLTSGDSGIYITV